MEPIEVHIVQLAPMRVASAHGFGASPETLAWDKLTTWAKERGLWQDAAPRRFFGFNNPDPSPGSPNYGYEILDDGRPGCGFGWGNHGQRFLRRFIRGNPLRGKNPRR